MRWTAGKTSDSEVGPEHSGETGAIPKGVLWILAGLVLAGLVAGYSWLRRLPKDRGRVDSHQA